MSDEQRAMRRSTEHPADADGRLLAFLDWHADSVARRAAGPNAVAERIAARTSVRRTAVPLKLHVAWIALLLALLVGLVLATIFLGRLPEEATGAECAVAGWVSSDRRIGTLTGSGFPPDVSVVLTFTRPTGEPVGKFTEEDFPRLRTDAAGRFSLSLEASPEDVGTQIVTATAGGCSAAIEVVADESLFPPPCVVSEHVADSRDDAGYVRAVRADEPLAYWRFEDEPGAETARDEVGERAAEYRGRPPLAQPGAFAGSRAVHLDGVHHVVRPPVLRFAADFTIEGWYFACGRAVDNADAFAGRDGIGPDVNFAGELLRLYDGSRDQAVARIPVTLGAWNHIAVVRRGTLVHLFLNGEDVGFGILEEEWLVSAFGGGNAGRLEGRLDDVAVYHHALTDERIAAHVAAAADGE